MDSSSAGQADVPMRQAGFARAAAATLGSTLGGAALSLVNVLVVGRALGPVGRGDLVFLTTVATFSNYLASLGVHEAIANFGGSRPERRPALATTAVVIAVIAGFAAIAMVAALIAVFPQIGGEPSATLRWIALASIPVLIVQTYFVRLVQSDYRFAPANAAVVLTPLLTLTVNATLWMSGRLSVASALIAWIVAQAAATAFLLAYVARPWCGYGRFEASLARSLVGFGVQSHAGDVMLLGNYRLDQWLLGAISGSRELGLYSVAVAWAEGLFYLPSALGAVQRPDLVRGSPADTAARASRSFRVAGLATIAAGLVMIAAAPVLCETIFGSRFSGSIGDLRLLVPGALGIVALKLLGSALVAQRRPLLLTSAIAIGFAASIAFDVLLIPRFAGNGAAAAASISYLIGGAAVAALFLRTLGAPAASLVPRLTDLTAFRRLLRHPRTTSS